MRYGIGPNGSARSARRELIRSRRGKEGSRTIGLFVKSLVWTIVFRAVPHYTALHLCCTGPWVCVPCSGRSGQPGHPWVNLLLITCIRHPQTHHKLRFILTNSAPPPGRFFADSHYIHLRPFPFSYLNRVARINLFASLRASYTRMIS